MKFRILYSTPFLAAVNQRNEACIDADTEAAALDEFRSWWTQNEWIEVKIHRILFI